ncbi:MAG: hypothetical protein M9933_15120 [Chitinophagaceae bacterium]|nr:hypothetical protein [Chitinophagaceae bacterium]
MNILSHAKETDQQKMLNYVQNKLSPEEKHEVEKLLIDSDFESDAAEGLEQVKDKDNLALVVKDLNKSLTRKLANRRKNFLKRNKPSLMLPVTATIIIIALVIMFYLLLRDRF